MTEQKKSLPPETIQHWADQKPTLSNLCGIEQDKDGTLIKFSHTYLRISSKIREFEIIQQFGDERWHVARVPVSSSITNNRDLLILGLGSMQMQMQILSTARVSASERRAEDMRKIRQALSGFTLEDIRAALES